MIEPVPGPHLHLGPLGRGHLGVVDLDLAFGHLVERLVHDPERLSHLLHSAQVPGKGRGKGTDDVAEWDGVLLFKKKFLSRKLTNQRRK